jgi:hypothetical protein
MYKIARLKIARSQNIAGFKIAHAPKTRRYKNRTKIAPKSRQQHGQQIAGRELL